MRALEKTLVISLTILLAMSFSLWAEEEEESEAVEKIDLPEAVMEAFANDYPEMVMTGVETEEIDGVTYYEIESGDGETDVIYLADGTLYSVEQEMEVEDLPQEVADALAATYPDGDIEEAEIITRGTEKSYEVVVVIENEDEDISYDVTVSSDGKVISEQQITEGDDEEAPDAVDDEEDEE